MQIINCAYYQSSEIDIPIKTEPLFVTSAGRHRLKTLNLFDTIRPFGRRDFQLLYVQKGKIVYFIDGKKNIAPQGSVLFYHPLQPQMYTYYLEDYPDIYWLHFSGYKVTEILKSLNLYDNYCYQLQLEKKYESLFDSIIYELTEKSVYYSNICTNLLFELLYLISRNLINEEAYEKTYNEIHKIVEKINKDYSHQINFKELAEQNHISSSWMNKLFNRYLHMSPQKYLNYIRTENAKTLLRSTNSISHIAESVGYNDSLYFSRIFRQETGMSPSEYRKLYSDFNYYNPQNAPWVKK